MKQDYIHMAVLLDRSGSMFGIRDAMIEGYNEFLRKQKESTVGTGTISLSRFDTEYEDIYQFEGLDKASNLDAKTFAPRGCTALNDSLYRLIEEPGKGLAEMDEEDRPDRVMVIIITDGQENASKDITVEKLKETIKHQEENYSWEFLYIGANLDVRKESNSRGVGNNMSFRATAGGASAAFTNLSMNVSAYRSAISYMEKTRGVDLSTLNQEDVNKIVNAPKEKRKRK